MCCIRALRGDRQHAQMTGCGEKAQPWPLPMLGETGWGVSGGGGHLSGVARSIGRGQGSQDDTPQAHSYIIIVLDEQPHRMLVSARLSNRQAHRQPHNMLVSA